MIVEMTRGHIRLRVGDKVVTIEGEALLPRPGEPNFVAYEKLLTKWDPPHEKEEIDEVMRQRIFDLVREELAKRKMTLEVE